MAAKLFLSSEKEGEEATLSSESNCDAGASFSAIGSPIVPDA
jgi:hypothetical protein